MKILAVIPARGGSKGILRKNLSLVGGKPLVAWTIEAALSSGVCEKVIVSTDCQEIAEVSRSFGAEVPFIRPDELATDESPSIKTLQHAFSFFEGDNYTHTLQLNPTSPLRRGAHIQELIKLLRFPPVVEESSAVSVCKVHHHPYWCKTLNEAGRLSNFMPLGPDHYPTRQQLPDVYALNGAMFLTPKSLIELGSYYDKNTFGYIMEAEDSLDIDEPWELYLANLILRDRDNNL